MLKRYGEVCDHVYGEVIREAIREVNREANGEIDIYSIFGFFNK